MDSLKVYFTCSSDESDTDQLKDENGSDSCDIGCYDSDTSLSCVAESMDGEPLENEPDEGSQNFEEKSVNTKEKPISEAREAPYDTVDRGCSTSDGETEHELNGSIQPRETVYTTACVTPKEKPLTSDAPEAQYNTVDRGCSTSDGETEHELNGSIQPRETVYTTACVTPKEKPLTSDAPEAPYNTVDRGCSTSDGEREHELNGSIQARETVYNTSTACVTPKEKLLTSDAPDRPTTTNRASIDSQSSSESDDDEHERKKPKRGAAYMMPLKDLPHSIRSLLKNVRRFWTKPHKLERVTAPLMLTTWSKVEERLLCK